MRVLFQANGKSIFNENFTRKVKSSKDFRAGIQNGFWGIKYLLIIGGTVGAFFIPAKDGTFSEVWMYFGMIGGFLFILIQLVLIVDFAHNWAESWLDKYEETSNKNWYRGVVACTMINYVLALVMIVLFYVYYTQSSEDSCHLHKFFVSFNLISCIIISILSVLPSVQAAQPRSGLLQASVVSLYALYLTWSAMSNSNYEKCKPDFSQILGKKENGEDTGAKSFDAQSLIGLVIGFMCVLYSSIRNSANSQASKLGISSGSSTSPLVDAEGGGDGDGNGESKVWDNESDGVAYNWSFFHIMFTLATLYIMMTLTEWYNPESAQDVTQMSTSAASMWVKMSSSWVCLFLYVWTLIAPIVLPDRDFN